MVSPCYTSFNVDYGEVLTASKPYIAHNSIISPSPFHLCSHSFSQLLSPGILIYIHVTTFPLLRKAAKGNDNWEGIVMNKGKTFQNQGKVKEKTTTAATSSYFQIYTAISSPWPSWLHFVPKFCQWIHRSLLSVVQVSKEKRP